MSDFYLCHHMNRTHVIVLTQTRRVGVGGGGAETYMVYFLWILNLLACPVYGCPTRAKKQGRLR